MIELANELIAFVWHKHATYAWTRARQISGSSGPRWKGEHWWLVEGSGECLAYEPLKEGSALFRVLAETEPTMEAVAAFASEYGRLGVAQQILPNGRGGEGRQGEALGEWKAEILEIRETVEVWDAVTKNRRLDRWIQLEPRGGQAFKRACFRSDRRHAVIAGEKARPQLWEYLLDKKPKDALRLAGLFHIQEAINQKLREHAPGRLLYNPEAGRLELHLAPRNLLGAIWLQFARAVEGNKEYRRCRVCSKWFAVSPGGKRRQAVYCSTRCRVKAYRDRQEEAVRRARAGETHSKIAQDLGTTVKTLRGWVQNSKERSQSARRRRTTKEGKQR